MAFTLGQLKQFIKDNSQLSDNTRIVLDEEDHTFRDVSPKLNEALVIAERRKTTLHEWTGHPGDYGYVSNIAMDQAGAIVETVITFQ